MPALINSYAIMWYTELKKIAVLLALTYSELLVPCIAHKVTTINNIKKTAVPTSNE
jgi:hypothetical protein